uniref:Lysine--tRNA ligase n=1 Tax=Anthurium amnicola TaxID=1678845 RepID=A0A1D1YR13_9ARAE
MFSLINKNFPQKHILPFLISFIIRCNAVATQDNKPKNGKKDIKIIGVILIVFIMISLIIMWVSRTRYRRQKDYHREIYDYIEGINSIQTDASTERLESITSSCRSSFSFRTSLNSIIGNMIRPTRPISATHPLPSSRTTDMSVLIAFDGHNQRFLSSFVTVPLSSHRRNHQNRHRNISSIYPESYLNNNEFSQDILVIEPPPAYKP